MSLDSVSSVVLAMQSTTALGIPLFHQRTATGTNLNPPPGQSAQAVLKRPTFTNQEGSSGVEENACSGGRVAVWRNQMQVHMSLTQKTYLPEGERLLKQQLGFEVILLEAKLLPVMGREIIKVSCFNTLVG